MRESIGSTWILQLVIIFILIFVSFLSVAIGYSKSFKIRNEALSIIEKYEGANNQSIPIIYYYMQANNYNSKGKCPKGYNGLKDDGTIEKAGNNKYLMCIKKEKITNSDKVYYDITLFYEFNLPVLKNIATFQMDGTTNDVIDTDSGQNYLWE